MPLPTTTYDTATVLNPSSALTDFTLMVDLSRMSAAWWAAAENIDATNGRAAKDDGTELACDWIDYTHGSPVGSGWLRVKWSGTLATSGTQVLRIYPPVTGNGTVAPGDALGSYNAYKAAQDIYLPAMDGVDRLGNVSVGTQNNSPVSVAGKVGDGMNFDRSLSQTVTWPIGVSNFDVSGLDSFSFSCWFRDLGVSQLFGGSYTNRQTFFANNKYPDYQFVMQRTEHGRLRFIVYNPARVPMHDFIGTVNVVDEQWHHVAFVKRATTAEIWLDGVLEASDTGGTTMSAGMSNRLTIAGTDSNVQFYKGDLNEGIGFKEDVSGAWIEQEYAQTNSQAAFWGTWTSAGGSLVTVGGDQSGLIDGSRVAQTISFGSIIGRKAVR